MLWVTKDEWLIRLRVGHGKAEEKKFKEGHYISPAYTNYLGMSFGSGEWGLSFLIGRTHNGAMGISGADVNYGIHNLWKEHEFSFSLMGVEEGVT